MNLFKYRVIHEPDNYIRLERKFILFPLSWLHLGYFTSLKQAETWLNEFLNKKEKTKIYPVTIKKSSYQSTDKCGTYKQVSISNE